MKTIVKNLVLCMAMAAPALSNAAPVTTINLGLVQQGTTFTQTHTVDDGAFSDTFNFTIVPNTSAAAAAINVVLSGAGYINFTSLLLDGAAPVGGVQINNAGTSSHSIIANFGAIGSGSHAMTITGQTFVDKASYNGNWSVTNAAAVPVPAAVWLFGSALVGLMGLSRRKSS